MTSLFVRHTQPCFAHDLHPKNPQRQARCIYMQMSVPSYNVNITAHANYMSNPATTGLRAVQQATHFSTQQPSITINHQYKNQKLTQTFY